MINSTAQPRFLAD